MKRTSLLASIYCSRGFAVTLMVLSNHLVPVDAPSPRLRYAPDGHANIADLGASWLSFCFQTKGVEGAA